MDLQQQLRNAVYEIKFSQQPGTHDNGKPRKLLTVEEALDRVCDRLGIARVNVKPLYEFDWNLGLLHSNISGMSYLIKPGLDWKVYVKYQGLWYCYDGEDYAITDLAHKERAEAPKQEPHPPISSAFKARQELYDAAELEDTWNGSA